MMTFAALLLAFAFQDPVAEEARADLHAWYANRKLPSPYHKPIGELSSADAAVRKKAGAYLLALFKRTVYDEENGLTPERRGYKMGGGPQDDAAEMRHHGAEALARAAFHEDGAEALAAALYLYRDDPWTPNQVPAIKAIARIRTLEASNILREAVLQPHPAFEVLAVAARESANRKLHGLDDKLRKLANHYHPKVREAGREAVATLKLGDIPEAPLADRLTSTLEEGLRRLARLPMEKIPEGAEWKRFTETTHPEWSKEPVVSISEGWLLKTTETELHVLEMNGSVSVLEKDKTVAALGSMPKVAKRVIDLRRKLSDEKDEEAEDELDKMLGRPGFMDHKGYKEPTVAEGMMAAWSFVRGDKDTAAGLLIPLYEAIPHEKVLLDEFRDNVATHLDARMLGAFCSGKYDQALPYARHLSGADFKGWEYQQRAIDLAEQIPKRIGVDFVTLTLPTQEEWSVQAAKMKREEKIPYLAERLRLIYAVQNSIPGGVDFGADQNRHVPSKEGGMGTWISLINPFLELYRLDLSGRELLALLPLLESRDYFLAYNLQRFMPNNPINLYRVRWLVASLVNTVAGDDILERSLLEASDGPKRKEHLAKAAEWCRKAGDKTLSDRLERLVAEGQDWEEVQGAIRTLDDLNRPALARALETRLPRDPQRRPLLFQAISQAGASPAVVEVARKEMAGDGSGWAALVVAKYGDRAKKEGLAELASAIRGGAPPGIQNAAVDALLEGGREADVLTLILPDAKLPPTMLVLQRLFERGRPEAREALRGIIDGRRNVARNDPVWDAMILWELQRWSDEFPDPPKVEGQSDELRTKARNEAAKKWIDDTFEKIRKGEKVPLKRMVAPSPLDEWRGRGRWIRQL